MGIKNLSVLISIFVQVNTIDLRLMICVTHMCVLEIKSREVRRDAGRRKCGRDSNFKMTKSVSH